MPELHCIPADHPSLPGHFPGRPVVPGVLLLDEVLSCVRARYGELRLCGAPQVKFLEPLLPQQEFSIELTGELPLLGFTCRRGDRLLASGKLQLEATAA